MSLSFSTAYGTLSINELIARLRVEDGDIDDRAQAIAEARFTEAVINGVDDDFDWGGELAEATLDLQPEPFETGW